MLDRLPELIDPLNFADKRIELVGEIDLTRLIRLKELLVDDSGKVSVKLFFSREGRLASIQGDVSAHLIVQCQNCLRPLEISVSNNIKLGIVSSLEEADKLSEDFDPLIVGDEKIPLKDIVEDELLLALPAFPKHTTQCLKNHFEDKLLQNSGDGSETLNSNNPFSVLAKLKITGDS